MKIGDGTEHALSAPIQSVSAIARTFVNLMVWIVLYGSLLSYIIGICDSAQPFIQGTFLEKRVLD